MKNRTNTNEVDIAKILQDQDQVTQAIQIGIKKALLKHKQAGNPVCEWKQGKVVWMAPEDIPVDKD